MTILQKRVEALLKQTSPVRLAAELGVSLATVYRWRSGKSKRAYPVLLEKLELIEKRLKP